MIRKKQRTLTLAVAVLAVSSVACSLQFNTLLGVQEGSQLEIEILTLPPEIQPLEGGVSMDIDISIGVFEILFGLPIGGDINVAELLIAAPGFSLLGVGTEEICVVPDPVDPGGGTFSADLGASLATFDVALNTIGLVGNPQLAAALPGGGFPFPFALQSQQPFGLSEILGILLGVGGDIAVSQMVDEDIELMVAGIPFPITGHIGGQVDLASADAFPTSPLLDDCIALLAQ